MNLDRSFYRFVTIHACDGQTDRRTDRILIARPRLHSMQRGKNERFFYIYICSFSTIFYAIYISDTCLRSLKSIFILNFDNISQSTADIYTSGFGNARPPFWNSTFGFHVSILTMCTHWHVILHLSAKFCSSRTNGGGVMTSYRFYKMAAIQSEIYV